MNKKELKEYIIKRLMARIHSDNTGDMFRPCTSFQQDMWAKENKLQINDYSVFLNGVKIYAIERRHAKRKVNLMYKELKPILREV